VTSFWRSGNDEEGASKVPSTSNASAKQSRSQSSSLDYMSSSQTLMANTDTNTGRLQ